MMMGIIADRIKEYIRCQPRASKLTLVQQYILPECDVEDLLALQKVIEAEITSRERGLGKVIDAAVGKVGQRR